MIPEGDILEAEVPYTSVTDANVELRVDDFKVGDINISVDEAEMFED